MTLISVSERAAMTHSLGEDIRRAAGRAAAWRVYGLRHPDNVTARREWLRELRAVTALRADLAGWERK